MNSPESPSSDLGITKVCLVPSTEILYFFLSFRLKGLPFLSHVLLTLGWDDSQVKVTVSSFSADTSFRGAVNSGGSSTKVLHAPDLNSQPSKQTYNLMNYGE